jgi:hypothetical protein
MNRAKPRQATAGVFLWLEGLQTVPAQRDYEADLERELEDGDQKLRIFPKIFVR